MIKAKEFLLGKVPAIIVKILSGFAWLRHENDEIKQEIEAFSNHTGIPLSQARLLNLLYEVSTIQGTEAFSEMCLGVVMTTPENTIYHGRNLDLEGKEYFSAILYDATFIRGEEELFTAQMLAGYHGIVSGMKKGKFGISEATRTNSSVWDILGMVWNVVGGTTQPAWLMRKVLEDSQSYLEAKDRLLNVKITSPIYFILSGLTGSEGVIISRDIDGPANVRELADSGSFIVQANKDAFDPEQQDDSRRTNAEKYLSQVELNPENLFKTINHEGVRQTTTFWQGVYSAQASSWYSSAPEKDD
eukprot:CAMPEP_0170517744 /NCGR_PEP_ID=MMETSP0209-20121228/3626_1 /TAXON_ID=665100 ORGANISM="Litonotus pictus, Strain P1" /NCGR_SAMPLE_ID=MMETSP0209 /ASSEMBLY_ACC=CAM_ASM_000301 /LENGTH=301 /DNA_ID=CAMNT_0010803073 /DNA_START=138 /DNA_END=1043 /DNA_ORIENTATION=+